MEYKVEKSDDATLMVLGGELTIRNVGALKAALQGAMSDESRNLVLDLTEVTDIDLSCLQLLCAAHRAFLERDKDLSLSADQTAIFARMVSDSGFSRALGCHQDPSRSCLWKEVETGSRDDKRNGGE